MISIANLKPLQNTLMKRRFLPFLATILSLLLPVTAYSQSCADEFAGTSFELKSGYSGICEIDGVRFTDPSSEDLAVSADFEEAEIPDRGNYSVHDNTLSIGISSGNTALFTYTLSDLITEAGRNEYRMQMTGKVIIFSAPSGAGKSTFLKLIMREEVPSSGTVTINGYNLNKMKKRDIPYFRRTMGIIFQDFRLIPDMRVYDNVE